MNKHTQQSEKGAVLVLVALLLVPIILFLALAIDSARLASSHSELNNAAGYAALAAFEAYLINETDLTGDASVNYEDAIIAAVHAAEAASGFPQNSLVGGWHVARDDGGGLLAEKAGVYGARGTDENAALRFGYVWPGKWWAEEPPSGCAAYLASAPGGNWSDLTCPCPAPSNDWVKPCFQKLDSTEIAADVPVTAMEVQLKTEASNPIRTVFARVGGQESVPLRTTAWAAMTPRKTVFIGDLSRSICFDTHFGEAQAIAAGYAAGDDADLHSGECAFRFNSATLPTSPTGHCEAANPSNPGANQHDHQCEVIPGVPRSDLCCTPYNNWLWQEYLGGATPATREADKHYRGDYTCYEVTEGAGTAYFVIDTTLTPEPLTSVLSGIHAALEEVEARSISGDEVGAIFLDDEILASRIFPSAGGLTAPGETGFDDLLRVTHTNAATLDTLTYGTTTYAQDMDFRIQKLIFPRSRPLGPGNAEIGAPTDIPEALVEAYTMLGSPTGTQGAELSVVLFSDGVTTVRHTSANTGEFIDTTSGIEIDADTSVDNSFNNFLRSREEIGTIMVDGSPTDVWQYSLPSPMKSYKDVGIALHVFLVGETVGPHTRVRKSALEPNKCMEDYEARGADQTMVTNIAPNTQAAYDSAAPNSPYYYPNKFYYEMAVETGGYWVPIRKPCYANEDTIVYNGKSCADGGLVDWLNDKCAARPTSYNDLAWPAGTPAIAPDDPVNGFLSFLGARTLPESVLRCDPTCRSKDEQVQDGLRKLYEENPYRLVHTRPD